ncbi:MULTISPECIES: hypothetical protein [Oxalobacteraceae]|uniref:hypothetical protein n=1 Tax=Herminiimonas sp. Marseille-P9896 TaxID=2742211 RepID=UPI00158A8B4E|nr:MULTISPECIES: hypothetical protein [Oxalobacteraceae]
MSWIPMYATKKDIAQLVEYLNGSEEIAFIVSNGTNQWIAVNSVETLEPGKHWLWHVPSGALPLARMGEPYGEIEDPFEGWAATYATRDPSVPYFGPGHPGVFSLEVRREQLAKDGTHYIPMSSFGWIGNRYRIIGFPANPATEKYWKVLKRWMKKTSVQVPRGGPGGEYKPEIWAFEDAMGHFAQGAKGVMNPF